MSKDAKDGFNADAFAANLLLEKTEVPGVKSTF
jgi:hypothetical protein